MWKELVDQEKEWIGGVLIDYGDSIDRNLGATPQQTTIIGFKLTDDWFEVKEEKFCCGGNRRFLGLSPNQNGNGITISGYGDHEFKIIKKERTK